MAPPVANPDKPPDGYVVNLNIYDVSNNLGIQMLNILTAHQSAPFKIGGIFHAAVEIAGQEWTFGFANRGSGVVCRNPRSDKQHHYRETVRLGRTRLTKKEITTVLQALYREYSGPTYSLLTRNCCHFAEDLCQRLGVGELPPWVHRLHRVGDSIQKVSSGFEGHLGALCPRSESRADMPCCIVQHTAVEQKSGGVIQLGESGPELTVV